MNNEHVRYAMDQTKLQLEKVFDGISEEHMDFKVSEQAMTPRETLLHLCDCYEAVKVGAAGGEYEWGSLAIEDKSTAGLLKMMASQREQATTVALDQSEEQAAMYGFNYIALHDAYHVGQMALVRMATDSNWNPYSIYGE